MSCPECGFPCETKWKDGELYAECLGCRWKGIIKDDDVEDIDEWPYDIEWPDRC